MRRDNLLIVKHSLMGNKIAISPRFTAIAKGEEEIDAEEEEGVELATAGQMQTADRSFFAQSDGRTGRRASGGRGRDEAINKVDVSRGMLSWGSVVFRRDGMEG